jgi:hypothetical protein
MLHMTLAVKQDKAGIEMAGRMSAALATREMQVLVRAGEGMGTCKTEAGWVAVMMVRGGAATSGGDPSRPQAGMGRMMACRSGSDMTARGSEGELRTG